ncbi:nucleoid-associated protein [Pseudomonas lalucatii]|nr:nucleoid-associated protein [Pseudomonas lalucatii]
MTALGCAVGTASAAATKNLILESVKFFRDRPDLHQHRLAVKDDILRYLEKQRDSDQSVKLSKLKRLLGLIFPQRMKVKRTIWRMSLFLILTVTRSVFRWNSL